ncbi:MAG: hypothetical protein MUF31_03485 [Akkermansiaceae bacterium]|nr:hypothetical protein [Akkermansiaceae bacterium]
MRTDRRRGPAGFTLAAVMVIVAAILLLTVGALALVGIERKTARSYVDAKRAEWIARAGMEDVRGVLREETASDDFLIVSKPAETVANSELDPLNYLYLARGRRSGESVDYRLLPLFSASTQETTVADLRSLPTPESLTAANTVETPIFPWARDAKLVWIPVEDEAGRLIGRYAYFVEDLQARVDAKLALESIRLADDGESARSPYPYPAPGLSLENYPAAEWKELDPVGSAGAGFGRTVEQNQEMLLSPDSTLAAAGYTAPLDRETDGDLANLMAAGLEQHAIVGTQPYTERPVIPFARGIAPSMSGKAKVNLNDLLTKPRPAAVGEFATLINDALPEFVNRKGGFPDDYLRTLGANALDYADADSDASVDGTLYRGLDAYPLVSEHLVRFRWENLPVVNGRKKLILSGTVYAELWNMTDKPVSGDFQISYETNYTFDLGVMPGLNLGSPSYLENPSITKPTLQKTDGYYWLPAQRVSLAANEYKLINCGTVTYEIDAGPSSVFVTSPIVLSGESEGQVGYRMKWNGTIVDQSRGNVKHPDITMFYPADNKTTPRQGVWTTIPGHSYSTGRFDYVNNMGDPRMAYYIGIAQDPNDYPDNYSPNRRTIRWGNVYFSDPATKPKVYGRVMPSEWPDGGHNSSFGSVPAAVTAGQGSTRGDERINPDDIQFMRNLPATEPLKAPARISNLGYFQSPTELGRVYDPLMWAPTFDRASDTNSIRDGFMPGGQTRWPLVVDASPASNQYGGGNTLRIGRPEHPRFQREGLSAAYLLDLFHTGYGAVADLGLRNGSLVPINNRININTAGRDALRIMAAGILEQDPALARRLSENHNTSGLMAPPTGTLELDAPKITATADVIADAIIRSRPFASVGEMAAAEDATGEPVFGNTKFYSQNERIQWSDSAAEEVFARLHNGSTLRSRNLRVWVIGQALAPQIGTGTPTVLAESRKVFTLFADPGERTNAGEIDTTTYRPVITHENDF